MRKAALYIAMSLDGYIADKYGKVDWLGGHGGEESADTYSEFIKNVDTVVMGWNTYRASLKTLFEEKSAEYAVYCVKSPTKAYSLASSTFLVADALC